MTDIGQTSDATLGCDACGAQNERFRDRCWACGTDLGAATTPDAEREDLELEEVQRAFVAEGYEGRVAVEDGVLVCPACGARFGAEATVVTDARRARDTPTARAEVVVLAITCPRCQALGVADVEPGTLQPGGAEHTGTPSAGYSTSAAGPGGDRRKPGATPEHPLGDDRRHFVEVEDGDTRSLRDRGPLLDADGDDIREYTGEPVETEEGTVIPQQQNVGPGNEAGGGEWPDPDAPPAQGPA